MKYLLIAPQLGFEPSGKFTIGGLLQFGRCVARAMASFPFIEKLGIWCQVDHPTTQQAIEKMVKIYAHPDLELDIRGFGKSRVRLAAAVAQASFQKEYDQVMYILVNQAVLALMPGHLPYTVWEVGCEMFQPLGWARTQVLRRADRLLSISHNTTEVAVQQNPGLPLGKVVHLCVEPPLFTPQLDHDPIVDEPYQPARRESAVMIVGNLHHGMLYKGHQQLIAAWPEVMATCPQAELWIAGGGTGQPELEAQAQALPVTVTKQVHFLGRLDDEALQERYRRCRVFAMPSTGEGFGLVFVEAARYGLPSIGGKHDSVKEVVLDNQTGLLVEQNPHEVAQACQRLLTDDDLAKRLGEAARQRYLNYFQFQHFRERLLTMIEGLKD